MVKVLSRLIIEPAFLLFVPQPDFKEDILAVFQLEQVQKLLTENKHNLVTADLNIAGSVSYQGQSMCSRAAALLDELLGCHRLFVYGSRATAFACSCIQTASQNNIKIQNFAVTDSQLDRHTRWFVR